MVEKFSVMIASMERFRQDDGRLVKEIWKAGNVIHRTDGPAVTIADPESGLVVLQEYYDMGELHRIDGPARIEILLQAGEPWRRTEAYYLHGLRHRADGPATLCFDCRTGLVLHEEWRRDGLLHRKGAPASITRDQTTGVAVNEYWYMDGQQHRVDGPASTWRDEKTGIATMQHWFQRDSFFRENGPAWISRDKDTGKVVERINRFKNGRSIPDRLEDDFPKSAQALPNPAKPSLKP